jgi:hypothetical protein
MLNKIDVEIEMIESIVGNIATSWCVKSPSSLHNKITYFAKGDFVQEAYYKEFRPIDINLEETLPEKLKMVVPLITGNICQEGACVEPPMFGPICFDD